MSLVAKVRKPVSERTDEEIANVLRWFEVECKHRYLNMDRLFVATMPDRETYWTWEIVGEARRRLLRSKA